MLEKVRDRVNAFFQKPKGVVPKRYIKQFLPSDPIIIEAGAHIGSDTVEMARLWKRGRIFSFEPVPELFERLCRNTRDYPNVVCLPYALGTTHGSTEMFISGGASDASSSLLPPKQHLVIHPDVLFDVRITVQVVHLDSWVQEQKLPRVDFLWLDLQGFEFPVLYSSPGVVESLRALYTEVSLVKTYMGTALYPELKEWLLGCGFTVQREAIPWSDSGNVLFVKRKS